MRLRLRNTVFRCLAKASFAGDKLCAARFIPALSRAVERIADALPKAMLKTTNIDATLLPPVNEELT